LIFRAIEFATKAHAGQYRKTTRIPYIVHPLGVAKILINANCKEEIVAAGVLHDTIEDTSVTLSQIKEQFGGEVAKLVDGATEPDRDASWENRKQHTINFLKDAPIDIVLVACADKLDNVNSTMQDFKLHGEKVWSWFNEPKDKQKWYHESLAEVFNLRAREASEASFLKEYGFVVKALFELKISKR